MQISICMCLFNGADYIEPQLISILNQTRRPDEVILCDDGSTDVTVQKVTDFIRTNRLQQSWKLIVNAENKGYPANFYYCMSLCRGDIVFLCDQDDVWSEDKLEKMIPVFESDPSADVVACKFGLIDDSGKKITSVLHALCQKRGRSLQNITLFDIFYRYEWHGMVLAYRNQWYQTVKQESVRIPHDIFLCAKAAESKSFLQLNEVLAYHRQHDKNTACEEHRIRKLLNKKRKFWEIEKYLEMLEQFRTAEVFSTPQGRRTLAEKESAMSDRYRALQSGKAVNVIKSAFRNRKNVRIMTFICDMLIVRQKI